MKYLSRDDARNHPMIFDTSLLDCFPIFSWQDEFGWHAIDFSSIEWISRLDDNMLMHLNKLSKKEFRALTRILSSVLFLHLSK